MRLTTFSTVSLLLATTFIGACNKESDGSKAPAQVNAGTNPYNPSNINSAAMGRYSGEDYSQSISIDAANGMIKSYLASVNFPLQDTSVRSFAFDADTLRSYLADTSIKTMRFHMAHTPVQAQLNPGAFAGYNPKAITLVIVGYSKNDLLIRNRYNGVYEHLFPCPSHCLQSTTGLLQ